MLSVIIAAVFLLLVVTTVKAVRAKGVMPYFLSYLIVIGTGFYGVGLLSNVFKIMMTNPVEAAVVAIAGVVSIGVMLWGLSTFKRIYAEA